MFPHSQPSFFGEDNTAKMGRRSLLSQTLLLSGVLLAGCGSPQATHYSDDPWYSLCATSALGPDIDEVLAAQGIVCLAAGGGLGGTDWVIQGSPGVRFRARELVREQVRTRGWWVSWPADHIVLMNEWDQIGFEKGPWARLADVEHQVTPTGTILDRLNRAGIATVFLFGKTSDLIFVKPTDAAAATAILRKNPDASIQIHHPRTCVHDPPRVIQRGTPTRLTLLISAADTGRPLKERVTDPTCFYRLPEGTQTVGYGMNLEERPDGTLLATYDLPPIPSEVQGSVEYHFRFNLDGRSFWHGSPSFRVPFR